MQTAYPASVTHNTKTGYIEINGRNRDAVEAETERLLRTLADKSPHRYGLVCFPSGVWNACIEYAVR